MELKKNIVKIALLAVTLLLVAIAMPITFAESDHDPNVVQLQLELESFLMDLEALSAEDFTSQSFDRLQFTIEHAEHVLERSMTEENEVHATLNELQESYEVLEDAYNELELVDNNGEEEADFETEESVEIEQDAEVELSDESEAEESIEIEEETEIDLSDEADHIEEGVEPEEPIISFIDERTIFNVATLAVARDILNGTGAAADLDADEPITLNLMANISITEGGTLNTNAYFEDVLITSEGNFNFTTNTVSPAITVNGTGEGRSLYLDVNVTNTQAAGTDWQGILVENNGTLHLSGNVTRSNLRSAGTTAAINVVENSTLNTSNSTITGFRVGVNVDRSDFMMNFGALTTSTTGVNVVSNSTFHLNNGSIGFTGTVAGRMGVHVDDSTFIMDGGSVNNSLISVNVISNSIFEFNSGAITGGTATAPNTANTGAGNIGVVVNNSTFTMRDETDGIVDHLTGVGANTIIQNNRNGAETVTTAGGGIHLIGANAVFNMYGGRIGNENRNIANSGHGGGGVRITEGAQFNLHGGTIVGNRSTSPNSGGGGGQDVHQPGGGGVYVSGSTTEFNMSGGYIVRNIRTGWANTWTTLAPTNANGGGGVAVGLGATFNMDGGTITNNTSRRGGGIILNGAGSEAHISGNARITLNVANEGHQSTGGGGVFVGTNTLLTMSGNSFIHGNGAGEGHVSSATGGIAGGGGVRIHPGGRFEMSGGTISDNRAGGGVAGNNWDSTGNAITETATSYGGGVAVMGTNSEFIMTGGKIVGNQAGRGGGVAFATGGAVGRISISGDSEISRNNASNTTATVGTSHGGGGGIANFTNYFVGVADTTGSTYNVIQIADTVILAGNTVRSSPTATVPANMLRNSVLYFNNNLNVRVAQSTMGSMIGDEPNPFNGVDIRVPGGTIAAWTVFEIPITTDIYLDGYHLATVTPDSAQEIDEGNTSLVALHATLERGARLENESWATLPSGWQRELGPGVTIDRVVGQDRIWRSSTSVRQFQLTNWEHEPSPIPFYIPGTIVGGVQRPGVIPEEIPKTGVQFIENLAQFVAPPYEIFFTERYESIEVNPGLVTLTAPETVQQHTGGVTSLLPAPSPVLQIDSVVIDDTDLALSFVDPDSTWIWTATDAETGDEIPGVSLSSTGELSVGYNVPPGTVIRVRLSVTGAHETPVVVTDHIDITVTYVPRIPTTITLSPMTQLIEQGESHTFTAEVRSQFDEIMSGGRIPTWMTHDAVEWSVISGAVTIDPDDVEAQVTANEDGLGVAMIRVASSTDSALYVEAMITINGVLRWHSVPENIMFTTSPVLSTDQMINIYSMSESLMVADSRVVETRSPWQVSVRVNSDLYNTSREHTIPGAFIYMNDDETNIQLNSSLQEVYIHVAPSLAGETDLVNISNTWTTVKGLALQINGNTAREGQYSGQLEWVLADVPTNGGGGDVDGD